MDITLVTAAGSEEVHGTDNEKKTGCGINLLKPENVTRYRRAGQMTDLKEITCEKCKASLAKKMIKADKKEMAKLLKEEKQREKMGVADEGIVPLGNTTAKITGSQNAKKKEEAQPQVKEEPKSPPVPPVSEPQPEPIRKPDPQLVKEEPKFIPGTGVAIDSDLAAFAINVPNEEPEPEPDAPEDDFLAQFAIQKPQEEVEEPAQSNVQDDFLAQFAIPTPSQPGAGASADQIVPPVQDIAEETEEMNSIELSQPAVPEPVVPAYSSEPAVQVQNEEDIMKLFSVENAPVQASAPVSSIYDNDSDIIDISDDEISAYEAPAAEIPAPVQEAAAPIREEAETDLTDNTEWNYVANQIFGFEGVAPAEPMQQQHTQPVVLEGPAEMEELPIPPVNGISAPALDGLPEIQEISAPVIDEIPGTEEITAPVLDEVPEIEEITAPVLDAVPEIEEITAPVLDELPEIEEITPPVLDETPAIEEIAEPIADAAPAAEDTEMPMQTEEGQTATDPEEYGEADDMNKYRYSTPIFADEIRAKSAQQVQQPVVQPAPAAAAQAAQPQVINVPQFAGYDANGQPVYTYVQMKLTGYDQNGQPVFAPIQGQNSIPAAVPQASAPVQNSAPSQAAVSAQPASPAQPVAPKKVSAAVAAAIAAEKAAQANGPTANVSQIAVNPHRSTSQSFINAIASSRSYADKNLIDTQGLKANTPVFNSVEDVLSSMGDDTLKRKQAAAAQQAVPKFEEYKTPTRSASSSSPVKKTATPEEKDVRFMTKAELKAKKKQDKIDAKFKKDMAKRGF